MNDSTPTSPKCPRCGSGLPANAPEGLCPRCLAALPLGPETTFTGEPGTAAQPPLSPEELAPHFPQLEILQCLGRGGMGVVYKARQKSLNRLVALKLLAPERASDAAFANRFTKEAHALAALNHPHIVTVYDFGRAGGFYFLLMEFVDGVNLRQAMTTNRFTPEQALAVVPPICEALQYAHDHGIVHRDIKPENLLMDKEGRVKIADFGIAKMLGEDTSTGAAESQPAGTPQYMAPEQKEHQRTDHRADIYSLGVVLYEMLTGELPGLKLRPPSTKVHIDVRLDEIVLRALEKTPELRYQTAAEMRTQVETITSSDIGKATAPSFQWNYALPEAFGLHSKWSRRCGALAFLGFLGSLGAVPGWERMFGFFGFFGFIGIATIVELFTRRADGTRHPALRTRWHKAWVTLLLAVAIALPVRMFLISLYVVKGDGAAPEIPMGSRIAVWKVARTFSASDIIAYRHNDDTYVGRFARREGENIAVSRNGSPDEVVAPARVIGRVISVYWRGSTTAAQAPADPRKRQSDEWVPDRRTGDLVLKQFTPTDPVISSDAQWVHEAGQPAKLALRDGSKAQLESELAELLKSHPEDHPAVTTLRERIAALPHSGQTRVVRLYEVPEPAVEDCTVLYRAKLMTKGLTGRAYLEMWCRFPGLGEAFSRGLDQTISGSNDWVSCQIPFFLKKGERPDLVRLNVVIEGNGEVYARDIELRATVRPVTAPAASAPNPAPLPLSDEDAGARLIEEAAELFTARRLVEAGIKYAEAVKRAPNNAHAWSGLGWTTLNADKVAEAQRAFERALALDPDDAAALNGLGNALITQHEYAKAELPLLKSAQKGSPVAWYLLTTIYLVQGRFEEAQKWAKIMEDAGPVDETTKKVIEAAKTNQLSEGLRMLLDPPTPRAK